jgi:hypothetical protein
LNPAAVRRLSSGGGGEGGVLAQPAAMSANANAPSVPRRYARREVFEYFAELRFIDSSPVVICDDWR